MQNLLDIKFKKSVIRIVHILEEINKSIASIDKKLNKYKLK